MKTATEIPSETAHTLDCFRQASDHLREAISLLLCCDDDEVESIVHVLKPVVRQLEGMVKLG